jgi:hypothetical protein
MATINPLNQRSEAFVIAPTGVGTPDPNTYLLQIEKDQNAATAMLIVNATNGANSQTQIDMSQTVGGGLSGARFVIGSDTNPTTRFRNRAEWQAIGQSAGINIATLNDAGTGDIRFYQGTPASNTEKVRVLSTGTDATALVVGPIGTATPDETNDLVQIIKSQNTNTSCRLRNPSNGTAAFAFYSVHSDSAFMSISAISSGYTVDPNVAGDIIVNTSGLTNGLRFQVDGSKSFIFEYGSTSTLGQIFSDATSVFAANSGASPRIILRQNLADRWTIGSNEASSNQFEIVSGSTLGTNQNIILTSTGGQYKGNAANTGPAAGFIGEQIRATRASGSALALSTGSGANVTSISLTAGIWDVSCVAMFSGGAITGTVYQVSISTTSITNGTRGDNFIEAPASMSPTAIADSSMTIPSYRLSLAAPTTVYLVAAAGFSVGALTVYGRLSATRVA